jgi:hypothetical protein
MIGRRNRAAQQFPAIQGRFHILFQNGSRAARIAAICMS